MDALRSEQAARRWRRVGPSFHNRVQVPNIMDHIPAMKCCSQDDVYVLSADIGREIEHIVDTHGVDSVKSLVPKLIRVLELLETAARQNETLREEAENLALTVKQLEYDKNEKAFARKKFDLVS